MNEWPFSQLLFLICMTLFLNVDVRQFRGNFALFARNCLSSTFKYTVMHLRKVNCEKGYWEKKKRYAHLNWGLEIYSIILSFFFGREVHVCYMHIYLHYLIHILFSYQLLCCCIPMSIINIIHKASKGKFATAAQKKNSGTIFRFRLSIEKYISWVLKRRDARIWKSPESR